MIRCDLHVHTDRDHGRHSAADMAAQAVRQGLHTLGLVGHAAMQFPCDYAMTPESEALFFAETAQLKQSYAQQLTVLCGIELDYYSRSAAYPYDYRLGSVHYVRHGGHILSVDSDPQELVHAVQSHWGGDWLELCRLYYETVADLGPTLRPDIVAHFDLITKFNEGDRLFSTEDHRYRKLALRPHLRDQHRGHLPRLPHRALPRPLYPAPYSRGRRADLPEQRRPRHGPPAVRL